ncbi:MAG: hypothetical protein ACI4RN_03850 [Oscillospiraceae bacterium]
MNGNLEIIKQTEFIVKDASTELCQAYNEHSSGAFGEAILSVLDGELRMAKKLSELEGYFGGKSSSPSADDFAVKELLNKEKQTPVS